MRYLLKSERPPFHDSVWLNAMAAIAVGMFIGHWVIAPAISTNTPDREPLPSAAQARQLIDEAAARPDPQPYRTPTPAFEAGGTPNYALAAKQKAQASLGGRGAEGNPPGAEPEAFDDLPVPAPARQPARSMDRHTGVRY